MAGYRRTICDDRGDVVPWKTWVDQRRGLAVTVTSKRVIAEYEFPNTINLPAMLYVIQSTLVGDMVMRLDSIREILRPICDSAAPVFLGRERLEKRLEDIPVPTIIEATAIVVAYRDSYLHAEMPAKGNFWLSNFRGGLGETYSLADVCRACLLVWVGLYRASWRASQGEQRL